MKKTCDNKTDVYGNIWVKQMIFKQGQVKMPHEHHFDHLFLLASGQVELFLEDKSLGYFKQGDIVKVPKDKQHKVVAKTDTIAYCLQAFRDKDLKEVYQTDFNQNDEIDPSKNDMLI